MEAIDGLQATIKQAWQAQVAETKKQCAADLEALQASFDEQRTRLDARIKQVENDNAGLRSQVESLKAEQNDSSAAAVSLEDHQKVKDELKRCKDDFAKINLAREIWESRYRHLKVVQKQWDTYTKKHILSHPRKDRRKDVTSSNALFHSAFSSGERSISEPAPPLYMGAPLNSVSLSPSTSIRFSPSIDLHIDAQSSGKRTNSVGFRSSTRSDGEDNAETADDSISLAVTAGRSTTVRTPNSPSAREQDATEPTSSPVVIAERSVRRKRHPKRSPTKNATVKQENGSSSPLQPSVNGSNLTESLDLDEVGGTLYTPRKRRRLEQIIRTSNLQSAVLPEVIEEGSLDAEVRLPSSDPNVFDGVNENLEPTGIALGEERLQAAHAATEQHQLSERDDSHDVLHEPSKLRRGIHSSGSPTEPSPKPGEGRDIYEVPILSPREGAERTLPRTGTTSSTKRRRSAPKWSDHGAGAVSIVSEDGDISTPSNGAAAASTRNVSAQRSNALTPRNRLSDMLEGSGTVTSWMKRLEAGEPLKRANTGVSRTPQSAPSKRSTTPQFIRPPTATKTPSTTNPTRRSAPTRYASPPPPINPDDEPLRSRPLSTLTLSSFKLNPKHSNYAYNMTIRRHDDKRSLSGCTDPFCQRCKDLTAAASLAQPPLSPASERTLLASYLGSTTHYLLNPTPFPPSRYEEVNRHHVTERARVLKLAREQDFRDRFGKHRQLFSKGTEAPGFWDTGFPSTQEEEERRLEAERMERVKVEERYRAAVRGGEWVFADEV